MGANRALLFWGLTQILFVYLVISHSIIDAKTIAKRDSGDVGDSISEEGEADVKPVQRGANFPTVKKDLETDESRSDIETEPQAAAESENEGISRADESVVSGESRESDPDMPNDDPFHTTTVTKSNVSGEDFSGQKIVVLDKQKGSADVESKPVEETRVETSKDDSPEGSRSEIDQESTKALEGESGEGQQTDSKSEEIETNDGTSRADSETLNSDPEEGSRASDDLAGELRSSNESEPSAHGSVASEDKNQLPKTKEGKQALGGTLLDQSNGALRDVKDDPSEDQGGAKQVSKQHPKPNPRPWYDPEKPSTTKPPPSTTKPPPTKPPTTTKPPPTKPPPTKPPTTTKPPRTKPPATTKPPRTKPPSTTKPPPTKPPTTTKPPPTKPTTTTKDPDCRATTKPCGDYESFKDSDKILAVVKTAKGGFKGRRINSKAIEKIMFSKLSGQQMELIRQGKEIKVSSNSSYVFPAGNYYFPYPIRFAGFVSP